MSKKQGNTDSHNVPDAPRIKQDSSPKSLESEETNQTEQGKPKEDKPEEHCCKKKRKDKDKR